MYKGTPLGYQLTFQQKSIGIFWKPSIALSFTTDLQ